MLSQRLHFWCRLRDGMFCFRQSAAFAKLTVLRLEQRRSPPTQPNRFLQPYLRATRL